MRCLVDTVSELEEGKMCRRLKVYTCTAAKPSRVNILYNCFHHKIHKSRSYWGGKRKWVQSISSFFQHTPWWIKINRFEQVSKLGQHLVHQSANIQSGACVTHGQQFTQMIKWTSDIMTWTVTSRSHKANFRL